MRDNLAVPPAFLSEHVLVYSGKQLGISATLRANGELQPNSATGETCSEVRVSIHWNVSGFFCESLFSICSHRVTYNSSTMLHAYVL